MLSQASANVVVSIAHHPRGEPWSRYVVMFVLSDVPQTPMAVRRR
jgi:hypothetical protein